MSHHKKNMKAGSTTTSREIVKYADAKIELLEECILENRCIREQHWIEHFGNLCVNQIRAKRIDPLVYAKEYREQIGKEVLHERQKAWRDANSEYNKERNALYFAEHKATLQANHNLRNVPVKCPHCEVSVRKYSLPRHIKSLHTI